MGLIHGSSGWWWQTAEKPMPGKDMVNRCAGDLCMVNRCEENVHDWEDERKMHD